MYPLFIGQVPKYVRKKLHISDIVLIALDEHGKKRLDEYLLDFKVTLYFSQFEIIRKRSTKQLIFWAIIKIEKKQKRNREIKKGKNKWTHLLFYCCSSLSPVYLLCYF